MRVITVSNGKGGSGKTTTAINLAALASGEGLKTLIIDADPQASAYLWNSARAEANGKLSGITAVQITGRDIHKNVPTMAASFDLVIIDSGGRMTDTMKSAIMAAAQGEAGLLIIPVLPSAFDVWASQDTVEIWREVAMTLDIPARFLLNRIQPGTNISAELEGVLSQFADVPLLDTRLNARVAYNCVDTGRGVNEADKPDNKAIAEVQMLWGEIKALLKMEVNHAS